MKTLFKILSLVFTVGIISACSTSYSPYAYDDVYYKPSNDPVNKVRKNPREDFNKTDQIQYDGSYENRYEESERSGDYPRSIYDNRYTEEERADNNQTEQGQSNITINNNNNDNTEYYDEDYAETLNRINSPVRSINTYDPYTRDRIIYTQDPFFMSPNLYGGYNFWNPYPRSGFGIGYNSWSGWNVGFGMGYGMGYSPWRYQNAYLFYDPFYSPWGYNPYGFGYGYGMGYGMGFGGYGMGYAQGYNHGFYNGYYGNGFVGGSSNESNNSGVRRISTPRGNSGSTTYRKEGSTPTRDSRTGGTSPREKENNEKVGTRPDRGGESRPNNNSTPAARPKAQPSNSEPAQNRPTRSVTPEKYQIERSPSDYSRPEPSREPANRPTDRPSRNYTPSSTPSNNNPSTRPSTPNTRPSSTPESRPTYNRPSYSRPSYNRPSRSNSNSRPNVQPQSRSQAQPQQRSQPSRPSYNNTPSYRPSGGGSRGGGSTPSRSTRPSRR
jgi:hypothetical protein